MSNYVIYNKETDEFFTCDLGNVLVLDLSELEDEYFDDFFDDIGIGTREVATTFGTVLTEKMLDQLQEGQNN